jgi:Ca2+-binding EF-hand superfamily protein
MLSADLPGLKSDPSLADDHRVSASTRLALVALGALGASIALASGCGGDDDGDEPEARPPSQAARELIEEDFASADESNSGRLERDEVLATLRRDFEAMDLDRDGVVTIKDIRMELAGQKGAPRGVKVPPLSEHLPYDANGDGRITFDEYREHVQREIVTKMDGDGDGTISEEEVNDHYGF